MFLFSLAVTFSGYFLVTNIPYSLALTKMWTHNNDWETVENWNLGRLPNCSNDIAKLELENTAVFINTSSLMKELLLPRNGSLVFGNSAQLLFSDGSSSQECEGNTITFTGYGSNDWFDPNNWQTKTANDLSLYMYPHQVPCKYDDVTFPKDSAYNVKVTKNVNVSKMFIAGKEQNETSFRQYVASNKGIQQIDLGESVSFHITGETCKDPSGCVCGINSKQRDYICNFITCPNVQCSHEQVKPLGGCCPICGTMVVLHISVGFNKTDLEKRIQDYLHKFFSSGIRFTAAKTEDRPNIIQVVLMDTLHLLDEESRTKKAAQSIRENLLSDKSILKIEILPKGQPAPSKSGRKALTVGFAIGVPCTIVFFVIVLVVVYLVIRRKSRTSELLDDNTDEVVRRESQIVQSERVNPLYDSTMEMEDIGFSDVSLSPIEDPENDDSSGRGNPLYEVAETD